MPARERLHLRPPDPGPAVSASLAGRGPATTREPRTPIPRYPRTRKPGVPQCGTRRPPGSQGRRRIVFADELRPRAPPHPKKLPEGPPSVPDYELKYPAVSDAKARSRYAAVFCDQYDEFLALQRQLGATQAKLCQLDALLTSLPPPRSQKEAGLMARLWMELEQKRTDPGFLARQARWRYLKGKLRHLKTQIRKFDDQRNSEGSVYF